MLGRGMVPTAAQRIRRRHLDPLTGEYSRDQSSRIRPRVQLSPRGARVESGSDRGTSRQGRGPEPDSTAQRQQPSTRPSWRQRSRTIHHSKSVLSRSRVSCRRRAAASRSATSERWRTSICWFESYLWRQRMSVGCEEPTDRPWHRRRQNFQNRDANRGTVGGRRVSRSR